MSFLLLSVALAAVPHDRILENLQGRDERWAKQVVAQILERESPRDALALYQELRQWQPASPSLCAGVARVHQALEIEELPEQCAVPVYSTGYTHIILYESLRPIEEVPGVGPAPGIAHVRWIKGNSTPTPIVVPLTEEPLTKTLQRTKPARFDLDGDGTAKEWSWLDPAAAWLVWGNEVNRGHQLFGTYSFGLYWQNGYHVLMALDDDRNGWLEGTELDGIGLWTDRNGDGVQQAGERISLSTQKIDGISTMYVDPLFSGWMASWPTCAEGVRYTDGSFRETVDWYLVSTDRVPSFGFAESGIR